MPLRSGTELCLLSWGRESLRVPDLILTEVLSLSVRMMISLVMYS